MTKEEIIEMANKASKEWLKEFPTPLETANRVPERYLEIFAKLVAEKEREACADLCEQYGFDNHCGTTTDVIADAIRARGQE